MTVLKEAFRAKFRTRGLFLATLDKGVEVAPRGSTLSGHLEEPLKQFHEWDIYNLEACFTPSARPRR